MSKWLNVDPKKLAAYLDLLTPHEYKQAIYAHKPLPLQKLMDKYDLNKNLDSYQANYGTEEYPVYGPVFPKGDGGITLATLQAAYGAASFPTYAGINRTRLPFTQMMYGTWPMTSADESNPPVPKEPPKPVETPHDRFKKKIARLEHAKVQMIADPNPKPPAKPRVPDMVGTITAWRAWGVSAEGILESLGTEAYWEPKRAEKAKCVYGYHATPEFNCTCGYWSFKTQEHLLEVLCHYLGETRVIGQVEIWGKVIECENGYRSEFAYPKELWVLSPDYESLSWTYGVPVRVLPPE